MLPVVAIVGRPNVGKSTLFNRLTKKRDALVDDIPGVTRDRLYATVEWTDKTFLLVDTGGFDSSASEALSAEVKKQVEMAIDEADLVILLFDGRAGPMLGDEELHLLLKRSDKRVLYAVNKIDGPEHEGLSLEFYSLGMDGLLTISSAHGHGIRTLMDHIVRDLPSVEAAQEEGLTRIAIIGRPNVGKSSLINRIIGSERLVVGEQPGTTRDAVDISFERKGGSYLFIDTAGIRRRSRVTERVEKFSIIKALKAIGRCHVSVILFDASEGIFEQDVRICGYALDRGCGIILAFNKWDLVKGNPDLERSLAYSIGRRLGFIPFAPRINISALTGERVAQLFPLIDSVWEQHSAHIPTPVINKVLEGAVRKHPPPHIGGKALKLFYATQVSTHPPTFIIFTNTSERVRSSYKNFLINQFRVHFGLELIPIRILFRAR